MREPRRVRRANRDKWAVLGCLCERGVMYPVDIWNALPMSSGRIYAALLELERQGVVSRSRYSPEGRAAYRLSA